MDPLSQGIVGSIAAQQVSNNKKIRTAIFIGFLSGMTPDLDIFIRSSIDPLLAIEFHRQFTHSLIFIPFGGLICGIFFYYLLTKRLGLSFRESYLYCTLGYASHGLLDACTSYGTQLFWPLSDARVAWNTISIIDPLFTITLIILVIFSIIKKKIIFARLALIWVIFYLSLGYLQHNRAEKIAFSNALSRGHTPKNIQVKPSLANLLVWKAIYESENKYYVDAVKIGLKPKIIQGTSIRKLNVVESFPWLDLDSQQAKDIGRFSWFSGNYLAISRNNPIRIIDIRYSMLPNEIHGLWGIEIKKSAEKNEHVEYFFNRENNKNALKKLWKILIN